MNKRLLECIRLIRLDKWEEAHNIAQDIPSIHGSLLHGILHEIEGDQWNADYWYRRAGINLKGKTIEEKLDYAEKIINSL